MGLWFIAFFLGWLPLQAQYIPQNAFPQLNFPSPIELTSPDDSTKRIFVVSQTGEIRVIPNQSTAATAKVFLNLAGRIVAGGEQGLLGMTFHPNYRTNGYFYVNYTRNSGGLQSVISRFKVSTADPDVADPNSELILLTFNQPATNHNGGKLVFGNDGYLYIATGDGGGAGDPSNYAQNRTSLLGKILRIDVDNTTDNLNYAIPADNPFVNNTEGFRKEIFAYGMRNPWKISVDKTTGTIWAADVGQNAREEIDIIENGGNYGWRRKEGVACYNPSTGCDLPGLIDPVWEYTHASGAGRSITGGFVYRGSQMPLLVGKYIYGDYVSGNVWALDYQPGQTPTNTLLFKVTGNIMAFGEDLDHNLYICLRSGVIQKIVDSLMPQISGFTPASGSVGESTVVTINGTQFNATAAENTVKFGDITGTVTAASATSLTVTIPETIPAGAYPVTVTVNGRTATASTAFQIIKFDQTITFEPIESKVFGDSVVVLQASASSGLPVVFTVNEGTATLRGDTLTVHGLGMVTVQASQAGNARYNAAPVVSRSFAVNKSNQSITFAPIADRTANENPFELEATASSGLAVTFEVASGPVTLSGNVVTLVGAGPVTIRASQPGNENYLPAPEVEQTFTVHPVTSLVPTLTEQTLIYPNPAKKEFYVKTAGTGISNSTLVMYSPIGKKVIEQTLDFSTSQNSAGVAIGHLSKGIYLVQLQIGDKVMKQKLIIE